MGFLLNQEFIIGAFILASFGSLWFKTHVQSVLYFFCVVWCAQDLPQFGFLSFFYFGISLYIAVKSATAD